MKKHEKKEKHFLLFFFCGVLLAYLIRRNRLKTVRFPQLKNIQKGLAEKYGTVEAAFLVGKLEARFEDLYSHRPRFREPGLQSHVDQLIIPVLALYQVLMEKLGEKEKALEDVHSLMLQVVTGKSRLIIPLLQKFPKPFSVFRYAVRLVNRTTFPAPGWKIDYIEDSEERISFHIHECLYVKVLKVYDALELVEVFCRFDDDIAALFEGKILWKRESTLAKGATMCDFCYENPNEPLLDEE